MASVISVPENEGISVKNEHEDPEINAMALKTKENYQKNATAAAKQHAASPANVYINRAGRAVTFTNAPITANNTLTNQDKLPKYCEDVESLKGRFSWELIAGYHVPYIIRVINGEQLKFVSVRMAECHLLSKYLHYLHTDIYYTCTYVRSYFITKFEARLLNNINQIHTDYIYGKGEFFAGKDCIVRLEDAHEFHTFIEVCSYKILRQVTKYQILPNTPGHIDKCGYIRINNSKLVVPYCIKDNQKYVPLLYFEGESFENLKHRAVKLENWNLAYLKFCFKVQDIRKEFHASDSWTVISLEDIKNYFPPETNFEESWPAAMVDTQLLINQKSTCVNPPGAWIRAPAEVVPSENTIAHTITAPAPLPPSMPVMMNTYHQNGWPANQMGSTMSQGRSLVNSSIHVVHPPPLVRAGNTTPVTGNTVSYSKDVLISECITTMYNQMTNGNAMSNSIQMRQLNNQRSNNIQAQQQQLQHQQIQQQQQIITTPQTQQPYSYQSAHGRLTNTQQRNALRNARPVEISPPLEIIELSSPPSSPVPPAVQENPLRPDIAWEFTRIPERIREHDTSNNAAYKIQRTTLQGIMIRCINAKPYIYSDLMVILHDLVRNLWPSCNVARCAYVLNKFLKTTLFSGNPKQLAVLRENGHLSSMYQNETPMARLQDVTHALPQLKELVFMTDEEIQQYQATAGGPAKRQRTS